LIVAHGNSLRAIVKNLDHINDTTIVNLNVATWEIYRYRFDTDLKLLKRRIIKISPLIEIEVAYRQQTRKIRQRVV